MTLLPKRLSLSGELRITDAEFRQLREFIYAKTGIFVDERRKFLIENRFYKRVEELRLRSFGEYAAYLRLDPHKDEELDRVIEMITTNETSFFRDGPQLKAFEQDVLSEVIERGRASGRRELHIWSAGCSSGEEPYTLSIMVREFLGSEYPKWKVRITAGDISSEMLGRARAGLYDEYSLRTVPSEILKKYFTPEGELFKINRNAAGPVLFVRMNLNDRAALKRIPPSDIVFCRNVIIYFNAEMKKKVAGAFYDNLVDGGALFLGHSESLHSISRVFKPVHHTGAVSYRKA